MLDQDLDHLVETTERRAVKRREIGFVDGVDVGARRAEGCA